MEVSAGVHREEPGTSEDCIRQICELEVGQRVMVHMPGEVKGSTWKFARPFHGPFRVICLTPTNAEVRLVDEPKSESIFVSLDRVRRCHEELPDKSWRGSLSTSRYTPRQQQPRAPADATKEVSSYTGPITQAQAAAMNKD